MEDAPAPQPPQPVSQPEPEQDPEPEATVEIAAPLNPDDHPPSSSSSSSSLEQGSLLSHDPEDSDAEPEWLADALDSD